MPTSRVPFAEARFRTHINHKVSAMMFVHILAISKRRSALDPREKALLLFIATNDKV